MFAPADPDLADLAVRQFGGRLGVDDDGPLGDTHPPAPAWGHRGRRIVGHDDEPARVQRLSVH